MEHIKVVLDIFRTNNIILYILFISSGLITFNILELREKLGLMTLDQIYFSVIGLIFVLSISCIAFLLVNYIFGGIVEHIKQYINGKKKLRELDKSLNGLSKSEICIRGTYYFKQIDTTWLPIHGPEVTSLVSKDIIYLSQKNGRGNEGGNIIFHYSLNPLYKEKVLIFLKDFFDSFDQKGLDNFFDEFTPKYMDKVNGMVAFM